MPAASNLPLNAVANRSGKVSVIITNEVSNGTGSVHRPWSSLIILKLKGCSKPSICWPLRFLFLLLFSAIHIQLINFSYLHSTYTMVELVFARSPIYTSSALNSPCNSLCFTYIVSIWNLSLNI